MFEISTYAEMLTESFYFLTDREIKQVAATGTVTGTEPGKWIARLRQSRELSRPVMLIVDTSLILEGTQICRAAKIIDMPMITLQRTQVMSETCPYAAVTKSAASIKVPASPKRERTEPADLKCRAPAQVENQQITAGGRRDFQLKVQRRSAVAARLYWTQSTDARYHASHKPSHPGHYPPGHR